jgi:hypothetical protein
MKPVPSKASKGIYNKKALNTSWYIIWWLGIQKTNYVALSVVWVETNIDVSIMDKAIFWGIAQSKGGKHA